MFKTRRQARKAKLLSLGFCKFEANPLSRVPFNVPYWRETIKARISALKGSIAAKQTKVAYAKAIVAYYQRHGWLHPATGKPDPWAMLRNWAERLSEKYPEYSSPWVKKPRKRKDFIEKFDRGEQKYPTGRAYPKRWG